jgi:type II secretory ATPase GspE/PulE/Tfp pilus assembly ATPase PilB-like protein
MVTGWEPRARTALLYAMARAVATPSRKVLTLERAVSYLVPDFVQVEVPGDFGTSVTTILDQPADVVMVEDIEPGPAIQAAFASAERGALVLAGIRFATNAAGLAHLLAVDVPRGPLLAATRGLVHVRRRGLEYHAEVLPMTEALRRELGPRPDGHR